jgi:hypothetical protein
MNVFGPALEEKELVTRKIDRGRRYGGSRDQVSE